MQTACFKLVSSKALALAAILVSATNAQSQPSGTIYFLYHSATYQMKSDGSAKTSLAAGVYGEPSQRLHGGHRWLASINGNGQLKAQRDDGQAAAVLTDPSTDGITALQFNYGFPGPWAKDNPATTAVDEADSFASFLGKDANGNQAVYRVGIAFDTSGVPYRATTNPPELVFADLFKDISDFDWSPDGLQAVYSRSQTIYIQSVGGSSRTLTSGWHAVWSPDGSKIAFQSAASVSDILTILPNGSGLKTVARGRNGGNFIQLSTPKWSPDSGYLIYLSSGSSNSRFDIYRITATGGSPTNLTSDLNTGIMNQTIPVGWR